MSCRHVSPSILFSLFYCLLAPLDAARAPETYLDMRCFLAVPLLLLLTRAAHASVLAIDYGTDWIKASLMKPGVPFDVLLNKDSKRKIQAAVGWKGSDRLFGTDAFNLVRDKPPLSMGKIHVYVRVGVCVDVQASRFPEDSFSSLKYLLAAPYYSEAVPFYATISTANAVQTQRKTVALRRSDGTEWPVEELIAMQFAYVKELAESIAGERVYDVVVAVPPDYSQAHRDAVADAVEIAGMRTLALVNDGTAVAVNYAMTRSFAASPEHHVIYDAGASGLRATVVTFAASVTEPKVTTVTIVSVGYDRTAGGTELDRRLREILIENFVAKHKRDIRGDKKAMAKLWKESGRLKAILSANADAISTVEFSPFFMPKNAAGFP